MKTKVDDALVAAAVAGGVTFERRLGWWTYTTNAESANRLGRVFDDVRDAVYIPTIQKDGIPVNPTVVERLRRKARQLGLHEFDSARGMWILSGTGQAQVEVIGIAWAPNCELRDQLLALAQEILVATVQDSVALEVQGELQFVGAAPALEVAT